jgi:hypothetical protein
MRFLTLRSEPAHVQALVAQRYVEGLHESVVGWLAWTAEVELHLVAIDPQVEKRPREFAPVIDEQMSGTPQGSEGRRQLCSSRDKYQLLVRAPLRLRFTLRNEYAY